MLEHQLIWLALLSLAASFAVCSLIVVSQRWHGKLSHDHDLGGVQKVHTTAVPRIGGIAVIAGVALGMFLYMQLFKGGLPHARVMRTMLLLGASAPAFVAGLIEDVTKRVSVRVRLAATMASAVLASLAVGATVDDLDIWGLDALLTIVPIAIVVTAIVVAGGCNAINIIDGFNGLSGSAVVIMAAGLMAIALKSGDAYIALNGALCIGATLGFLLLNYPAGRLFLGDGGAYFLGFWLAEMAVLLLVRQPAVSAWQVLAVCAYPIIEVMFSVYRRKFIKKVSPGAPDALHLHALIFRRLVFRHVRLDVSRPWRRNASVAFVMAPVIAICVLVSVQFGDSTPASIAIVIAQLAIYIAIYRRLVRGKWTRNGIGFTIGSGDAKTEPR